MRKQKLDVAFYDEQMRPHLVRDVILSDKTEINQVNVEFKFPVQAIVINSGDHAYAKIRYD